MFFYASDTISKTKVHIFHGHYFMEPDFYKAVKKIID